MDPGSSAGSLSGAVSEPVDASRLSPGEVWVLLGARRLGDPWLLGGEDRMLGLDSSWDCVGAADSDLRRIN